MRTIAFVRLWKYVFGISILLYSTTTISHAVDGWWIYRDGEGRGEPLCQKLLKRLAKYEPKGKQGCGQEVLLSYPEFTEPPWEELDPKQYEALIFELIKYYNEGPQGYFHSFLDLKLRNPDSLYRNWTKEFLQQHGRLRMWRTRLLSSYDSGPTPQGEQTIVQMGTVRTSQPGYCTVKPQAHWMGGVFFVTPDLSGPDPNIGGGTFTILAASTVLIHEGTPVIINLESIYRDYPIGFSGYCGFEFVKKEKK